MEGFVEELGTVSNPEKCGSAGGRGEFKSSLRDTKEKVDKGVEIGRN